MFRFVRDACSNMLYVPIHFNDRVRVSKCYSRSILEHIWAEKSWDISIGGATRKWTWFISRVHLSLVYVWSFMTFRSFIYKLQSFKWRYFHLRKKKWKNRNIASWSNIVFWWENLLNNDWNGCRNVIPHLLFWEHQFIDGLEFKMDRTSTKDALEGQKRLRMRKS